MFNLISLGMLKKLTFSEFSEKARRALQVRLKGAVQSTMDLTGLSLDQIAEYCGMDPSTLSDILRGKHVTSYPRLLWVQHICHELYSDYYSSFDSE